MGSTGAIIGGIVGGIVGFFVGGGPIGAVYGFAIGYGIGSIVDPITPDVPPPGKPQVGKLNITTADEGLPIADALGTTKITGNIIWYANNRTVEIPPPAQEQGKGGIIGPAVGQATGQSAQGYHYYLTWANSICSGPVDTLYTIFKGDDCVWEGVLDRPETGGEETISIPDIGSMTFFFGTTDQVAPAAMTNLLEDPTLSPDYKRLCYAFFNDGYLGQYNRLPIFKFVFKKSPPLAFNDNKEMETYFYNPAHGIYYVLTQMIGLDPQYINNATFSSEADKLFLEDRGVNILFDRQAPALSYLETILHHVDGVLRWGIDGRLHLKLMRADEDTTLMQVVTEDIMINDFNFERKSWLDTQNEIKVQYPLLVVGDCELCLLEDTDAPTITLISQNGTIGSYEITDGCPPFMLYGRTSSSSFGPFVFIRTLTGRNFNEQASYIGCNPYDIDREIKVVDSFGRDSNFIDTKITATQDMIWGGNPVVGAGDETAEISWALGSPPFTLQSFNPLITFDDQFYSQFKQTGEQSATVYFTDQACGLQKITITDNCGRILTGYVQIDGDLAVNGEVSDDEVSYNDEALVLWTGGIGPFTVELVGTFEDCWLDEAMTITSIASTQAHSTTVYTGPDVCGIPIVKVTDHICLTTFEWPIAGPESCHFFLFVQLASGTGVDGSTVGMIWNPDTNDYEPYPKNGAGDIGDNPSDNINDFIYIRSGNNERVFWIGPKGKNGIYGIEGGTYDHDSDEQMTAPIAVSQCAVYGSSQTCELWDGTGGSLTDLCSYTFVDLTPPDDNYRELGDVTENAFYGVNADTRNVDTPQNYGHLLKVRDQRNFLQTVGEDEFDDVLQRLNYDIDCEILTPLSGSNKTFALGGTWFREKPDRASNWNEDADYVSGTAFVPWLNNHLLGGNHCGIYSEIKPQVSAAAFYNVVGVFDMSKWYPYDNQYIELRWHAVGGYGLISPTHDDLDITSGMYGRNTTFETALEDLMEFWFTANGFPTTDLEINDLTDQKYYPEIRMEWIKSITFPTTTTTV